MFNMNVWYEIGEHPHILSEADNIPFVLAHKLFCFLVCRAEIEPKLIKRSNWLHIILRTKRDEIKTSLKCFSKRNADEAE